MTGSAGRRPERSLIREGFARRAAVAVLVALALALVLQVATADGPDAVSGGLGGDYPAFHAAGEVLLDVGRGDASHLYDPPTQFAEQDRLLPSDEDGNLYFAYPAFFAVPFAALAALPFAWSYLVAVGIMVAALVGALLLLRPCSPTLRSHPVEALAAGLTFLPLLRGTTGGQNTALLVLLFAAVWRALHDDRDVAAGVAAGLLLFKPPLALPVIGGLLLARRPRAVVAAALTAVALYGLGAAATEPGWPAAWIDALRFLDEVDTPANVENFVSLPGFAEAVFGIDSTVAAVLGWLPALLVIGLVSREWAQGVERPGPLVALTAVGAVLMSPHALYYDAGLLVLAALVVVDERPDLRRWLPMAWLGGLLHLLAAPLGADPLVVLVVVGFAEVLRIRRAVGHQPPVDSPTPAPR